MSGCWIWGDVDGRGEARDKMYRRLPSRNVLSCLPLLKKNLNRKFDKTNYNSEAGQEIVMKNTLDLKAEIEWEFPIILHLSQVQQRLTINGKTWL